jgi:hypothetical protein
MLRIGLSTPFVSNRPPYCFRRALSKSIASSVAWGFRSSALFEGATDSTIRCEYKGRVLRRLVWADAVEKLCFLQKTVKNFAIERR